MVVAQEVVRLLGQNQYGVVVVAVVAVVALMLEGPRFLVGLEAQVDHRE
jgi:hypothetical protein